MDTEADSEDKTTNDTCLSYVVQEALNNNEVANIVMSDTMDTESVPTLSQKERATVQITEREQSMKHCTLCKNSSDFYKEAASFCLDCNDFMCTQCFETQCGTKLPSEHRHISSEEYNSNLTFEEHDIAEEKCLKDEKVADECIDEVKDIFNEVDDYHAQDCVQEKQILVKYSDENATLVNVKVESLPISCPENVEMKRVQVFRSNQDPPKKHETDALLLWCEPCLAQQQKAPAVVYCEECDNEVLCEACEKYHSIQKSTRLHVLKDVSHYVKLLTKKSHMCEPCKALGKSSPASLFCKECDTELLCEDCGNHHANQKSTRGHMLQDINCYIEDAIAEQTDKETMLCEPCQAQKKTSQASVFCKECDNEFLCVACEKYHRSQKLTREHKLHDISNYMGIVKAGVTKKQKMFCEPCEAQEKITSASFFCKECDNELLCEPCGKYHNVQKSTREHILQDISTFMDIVSANATDNQSMFCEPCKAHDKESTAYFYCAECDNELLCEACGKYHSSQKLTRGHQLQDISKYMERDNVAITDKKQMLCKPCQAHGKTNHASLFCIECDNEYLCKTCGKYHNAQKSTRLHKLQNINKVVEVANAEAISIQKMLCEPCKEAQDNERIASLFCAECDNQLLCESCGKYHSLQKLTRGHKLQDLNMLMEKANADVTDKKIIYCEPCKVQGKTSPASFFCVECHNESLCETCRKYHNSRKTTRWHTLQDISNYSEITVDEVAGEQKMLCGPCQAQEKSSPAIFYCAECDNELLCDPCGKYHISRKSTRGHNLKDVGCVHMEVANASSGEVSGAKKMLCGPCKSHEKEIVAYFFCAECKNELFCENCGKYHKRHKTFRNHVLQQIDVHQNFSLPGSSDSNDLHTPGRPVASHLGSDTVTLSWTKPARFKLGDVFQIGCREYNESRWKIYHDNIEENSYVLKNLRSNSHLVFRIRAVYSDFESNYSDESEVVTTPSSPASRIVEFSTVCGEADGSPVRYSVPMGEVKSARNCNWKTRKFEVGSARKGKWDEKTILLIGETGTGKSTLVDGMANFILGVNWNDPFRFAMVNLEDEERKKHVNQALSQTEWITCYAMHPQKGGRLQCTINIIDTPGFGDTRGLQKDNEIVEHIRELFSVEPPLGVVTIDAVCFLIKAPDARLTPTQSYIFQSIMSLFGKDIEDNLCSLITFADGIEPPVIAALKESKLPFGKWFTFNNSALFAKNTEVDQSSLSPMFWEMGQKSFQNFFLHLDTLHTKSLQLTSDVLNERLRLDATIKNLEPLLDAGLIKINELKFEMNCFEENKAIIADNKDFKYTVKTTKQLKKDLPIGQHVTNCIHCNFTCHEKCKIPNNEEKSRCSAMDKKTGDCKICPENCYWDKHANTPYIFEYVVVDEEKTYAEMKKKYQDATGKLPNQEQLIAKMDEELNAMVEQVDEMMDTVKTSNNRLAEIALRPNPLTMTDHIDLLIENEKMAKRQGWGERIKALHMFRKRALIAVNVDRFRQEATICVTVARKSGKGMKNLFQRAINFLSR